MEMTKHCKCCNKEKQIDEFFSSPFGDNDCRTSIYCKPCHSSGKIKYGYGWYAGGHQSPHDTDLGNVKISWIKQSQQQGELND